MSRAPSDVLAVLFLAREAGLFAWPGGDAAASRLDVVPLFETIAELRALRRHPGAHARQPALSRRRAARAATASR